MTYLQRPLVGVMLIILIGLLAYSNTFDVPFQFDDNIDITGRAISGTSYLGYFMDPSKVAGFEHETMVRRYFRTRYVGFMSLLVNYRFDGLNVFGYHVVNLSIHIINALLVYLFVLLTFRTPALSGSSIKGHARLIALFSALLFVSHPLQTEAVTYISKRVASLATMFYLISIMAYAGSRLSDRRASSFGLYIVTIVSALLAMKTKEIAFTLPLAIMMYEFIFIKGTVGRRVLLLLPLLITMLIIPYAYVTEGDAGDFGATIEGSTRFQTDLTRTQYLFTQFRVLVTYMRLFLLPINQNIDYDYPLYGSFFEPPVAISFLFLAGVFLMGLYLLFRSRERAELRLVAFGVFWFFLVLSVESSFIPLLEIIVEYRAYLPSVGVSIAFAVSLFILFEQIRVKRPHVAASVFLIAIFLLFATATFARNQVWSSEISLWEDAVRKAPGKARPHNNLGNAYEEDGRHDEAIEHLEKSIKLNPEVPSAQFNLANAYSSKGLSSDAIEHYKAAIRLNPDYADAYFNLADTYRSMGSTGEAIKHYLIALKLNPGDVDGHVILGIVYLSDGNRDDAARHFRVATTLAPTSAEIFRIIGLAYKEAGFPREAASYLSRAKELPL